MNRAVAIGMAFILSVVFSATCLASKSCEALFKGTGSKLSKQDKQQICDSLGFTLSRGGKFADETCGDLSPKVEITDLNGDGVKEVFVYYGNTCTSGNTGRTISLFIKNAEGSYTDNLGFPASACTKLPTGNGGFPDLKFGGPGFCSSVWQWTGAKYDYKCSKEEEPGACKRMGAKKVCK